MECVHTLLKLILITTNIWSYADSSLARVIDSDTYSDEVYHQLAAEYEYELIRTTTEKQKADDDADNQNEYDSSNIYDDFAKTTTKELYIDAITRLKCDNPWFWNSFKCLWLDVKKRNYVERTKSNAITVAWIIGPPIVILLAVICGFCVVTCYLRSRVKTIEKKIDDLRNTYEPGKITLLDGKVKTYQPTGEEVDAFEDLMATLVSIV